ncbi:metallophosphoesterase family protein [Siphonobacter aquaeclarae]|nr:metallophosphoesterase family protein [Siphonobacter aquaeclarae]
MKIALFADIHANLPALEAVLADIDSRDVDAVYCLGIWLATTYGRTK